MDDELGILVGGELNTVSFVMDYVEFRIDYSILRALTGPSGFVDGVEWRFPADGAADLMRRYIGRSVVATEQTGDRISLIFDDYSRIDISLSEEDRIGPEAAHFVPADERGCLDTSQMLVW